MAEFRFYGEDIYELAEQMQLREEIATYNGLEVASVHILYGYEDLVLYFARPISELSIITNHIMEMIYLRWHQLLTRCTSFPGLPTP